MKILPQMYLWTGKKWLNFGTHAPLDHNDTKTEKLQQYNSDDSTSMLPLFIVEQKQS